MFVAFRIVGFVSAIVVVGFGARWAAAALATHSTVATVVVYAVAVAGGLGGVIGAACVADQIEFAVLGYQIRAVARNQCAYVERDERGTIRELVFDYIPLVKEFRPPCVVRIPSEARWDTELPPWARGRRVEIADQIAKSLVSYHGVAVQLLDEHERPHE